jgi:hypothetical protein
MIGQSVTVNKSSEEYDRFNDLMGNLLKVPHSELKEKLDEEKEEKKRKKESKASSSASPDPAEDA